MASFRLIPHDVIELSSSREKTPYGIEMIQAAPLWDEGYSGKGVTIAVIDSGCDSHHPELKNRIVGGYNFSGGRPSDYRDDNGHGTHVAGTIAASRDQRGLTGVAPNCNLLILKAFDKDGAGSYNQIIQALEYAIKWRGPRNERVRIASLSFGGRQNYKKLHKSIKKAVASNILVVCAAGNNGDGDGSTNEYLYPGYYDEVVQVGAIDKRQRLASFSNTNDEVDLVAPGVDIESTYLNGGYATLSGTSMATPHAAGAAALLLEKGRHEFNRELTEPELYAQLIKHTRSIGYSPVIEGNGLLDLSATTHLTTKSNEPDEEWESFFIDEE
ncbi:serine protease [Pontibacillus halophilus JSM 076056 = DSM 19796]|uniref:Serine protease n=1 Tax=Pontibacillus halophilus JSM 076056 = DSM 19796 TaxID=1385510 RepID=A0A0A5GMA1_9BACI|nr:S8 family peptidase [Pontibacillus halophilus]KGX93089.1 serine protease [Pontibacillus halophilus JSM 076056 = DSM 19796]